MDAVDFMVNCYERTYRDLLAPGVMKHIVADQEFDFASVRVLINNVNDRDNARCMVESLVDAGEIDAFHFVSDHIEHARRVTKLPARVFRRHPYFLDYAIVMGVVGDSPMVVGWDAEVRLEAPADWITPSLQLMGRRADVFSCNPNWQDRGFREGTLHYQAFSEDGPHMLNWGFSDQAFLIRRSDLSAPIYRTVAPAAMARHRDHLFTFEARVEAFQRSRRRPRGTLAAVSYVHNDLPDLMGRVGGERQVERARRKALSLLSPLLESRKSGSPAWRTP